MMFLTSGLNAFFFCHLENCHQNTVENADDSQTYGTCLYAGKHFPQSDNLAAIAKDYSHCLKIKLK